MLEHTYTCTHSHAQAQTIVCVCVCVSRHPLEYDWSWGDSDGLQVHLGCYKQVLHPTYIQQEVEILHNGFTSQARQSVLFNALSACVSCHYWIYCSELNKNRTPWYLGMCSRTISASLHQWKQTRKCLRLFVENTIKFHIFEGYFVF